MAKVAVVYHSGFGHTKAVAEAVLAGARSVDGASATLVAVEDLPKPSKAQPAPGQWAVLDEADALILGCPTYMGSVSAGFKTFMEASSHRWFTQAWKDKLAAGFTNSGSQHGDKFNTLMDLVAFAGQHAMVWVGLDLLPGNNTSTGSPEDLNRIGAFLGVMTQSNNDQGPEAAPPASDRRTAEHLGRRVAEAALRWASAAN